MHKSLKKIFISIWIIITILLILGGFILGEYVGLKKNNQGLFWKPTFINTASTEEDNIDWNLFWQAYYTLKDNYHGTIDSRELLYGAINGMASATKDPYTVYLSPDDLKDLNEELSGEFEGIGAEIGRKDGELIIIAPLEGSPAQKAGLLAGDKILKINNEPVDDLSVEQAVAKIRGEKGTEVTISILRANENKEFKIIRDNIILKSVESEIKQGNIGYIQITNFGDDTNKDFKSALDSMKKKNLKALIIDVRSNPGGYLQTAVDISSNFIPKGKVVVWEREKDKLSSLKASGGEKYKQTPIYILINEGSASASEIFAGAMQDYKLATLVGEKSFGKGSVQTVENLKSGAFKITVAEWLTPNKNQINKKGLKPDEEVIKDETTQTEDDNQLNYILEKFK